MTSRLLSTGLICALIVGFGFPALGAAEHTYHTPIIHITETASSIPGQTNYAIELLNSTAPINIFEFELLFSSTDINITNTEVFSSLCDERFMIDNSLDIGAGRWHVACGTTIPQSGDRIPLATFSVTTKIDQASALVFGSATQTYVHDGLGTQVTPHTIGTVYNQPAV